MAITVPSVQITGTQEAIIRDNVENPDSNLGTRALSQLVAPYRNATLGRAQAAYRAAYAADPTDVSLPNMLNDEAVIEWYLGTASYKDATQRFNEQRAVQAQNEIQALESERGRHQRIFDALPEDATQERIASLTKTIAGLTDQIAALQG